MVKILKTASYHMDILCGKATSLLWVPALFEATNFFYNADWNAAVISDTSNTPLLQDL